ncbi:ABC transporter permease subunit [candidate division KSB1 bacterium]|nr:ABC transporter permease subunit [candidate division KSB1 bacterium]
MNEKKNRIFDIRSSISNTTKLVLSGTVALLMLTVWSALSYSGKVSSLILPAPDAVLKAFGELWMEQELYMHVLWSFVRILAGFILAMVVSIPLGIAMGTFPVVKHAIHPFTGPLRYLPIAALIPLFIVWFGMDETMKILFLFVGIVVYLLPLVIEAVEEVDTVLLETAYTLKATRWQVIYLVLWQGAKPLVYENARVMWGIGWTYIILAEIINAPYGLGRLITIGQKRSLTHWIFAGIIIILIIGFVSDRLIAWYNAKTFAWKESPGK